MTICREAVDAGRVLKAPDYETRVQPHVGRYKRVGNKWKWERSEEEDQAMASRVSRDNVFSPGESLNDVCRTSSYSVIWSDVAGAHRYLRGEDDEIMLIVQHVKLVQSKGNRGDPRGRVIVQN